ncbi:unnamed protein product [Prunus armeniaca]|uniref:Cyclic nucleotide-binding domain-containing protein n=1 Tax=Prunus armeniaca TaxID=36596 RepID=A0A6J5X2H0_PRUAR|nr:hypothetical protein GBA52_012456 [Prunus armeniaca]CAB4306971.1 unnamed protein product [Prunus armeniaca]
MSLQSRVDPLTKIISDAPGTLARCLPSKVRKLLTKKWERTDLSASFWNKMIVISCIISIALDPLFLYIPFIDEEKKCLGMDKNLRNAALILRSLMDITFLVHIGYQIYEGIKEAYKEINKTKVEWELDLQMTLIRRDEIIPFAVTFAGKLSWGPLLLDLLSVFPMPQILVTKVFLKMRGGAYNGRTVVNFFLLSQYLLRIGRIILSSKQLTWTIGVRVKALVNLFLYILASHVLGAFWYFFSIQREISCWYMDGKTHPNHEGFYCDDHTSTKNITLFNEYCGTDAQNNIKPRFNYGIFLDSLEIGNTRHVHFPTKLSYSFWWGLRNLSNFGTNLTTSNYAWENFFAILISITGLLLFVYLIGNVQAFIQMETTKSEKLREHIDMDKEAQKIIKKQQKIENWMEKVGIPDDLKKEIININPNLEEDKDADLENLFNCLPWYMKKSLTQLLGLNILSQVELLKETKDEVLKAMCDDLTPVTYAKDKIIIRKGDRIDRMLLIIDGTVSFGPDSGATKKLERGLVYGEELLKWASRNQSLLHRLPTCPKNVICHTKVEGFALLAKDLESVVSKYRPVWK